MMLYIIQSYTIEQRNKLMISLYENSLFNNLQSLAEMHLISDIVDPRQPLKGKSILPLPIVALVV
jgi:hypothetical protein